MAGMLQIITYLLAFYLVMKGVEILQIGLASSRENTGPLIQSASYPFWLASRSPSTF